MLLLRFANDLEEYGKVEQMPVLEGKRMIIFIAPKKTAVKKAEEDAEDAPVEEEKPKAPKAMPKQKAPKEYLGPKVEGDEF